MIGVHVAVVILEEGLKNVNLAVTLTKPVKRGLVVLIQLVILLLRIGDRSLNSGGGVVVILIWTLSVSR
jgi:hypothetical protein